jgi:hypothetical protein
MAALLGDGLPALRLTEQDLQVDRKLPEAKQKPNITPQKDVKENQLKDGAVFRSSKQKEIKATMNSLQGEEHNRKMFIKKTWNSATDVTKQSYMNMISNYNLPEYKNLIDFIKKERAWWKSTYSAGLTVSVLENVFSDYADEVGDRTKRYEDALAENEITGADLLEQRSNAKPSEKLDMNIDTNIDWDKLLPESAEEAIKAAEELKPKQDPFKRTVWDDVNDSWLIIGGFLGTLIWIILGLRFGSSIANEYYYLKAPYKILMFVYTVIFTPLLIPYFVYKTLRTWLFPDTYPAIIFRCFLPLYESDNPNTSSWFTYFLDEATIADKYNKLEAINMAKRNVLKESIMEGLKIELAKNVFMAAQPPAPKGC